MRRFWFACLALAAVPLAAQTLSVEPYRANGWAKGRDLPERVALPLKPEALRGVCDLFLRVDALRVRADIRTRAHAFWLGLAEEEESAPSDAALRFELVWQGRRYPFDRWGRLAIDRRFIRPEDGELLSRFEAFYRAQVTASALFREQKLEPQRRPEATAETLPLFAGFEDDRYQAHDALILRLVAEFNANPGEWVGAEEGDDPNIPPLDPALIKALMIEETGGGGARSLAAWDVDPLQVNVPGDWAPEKAELGLKEPRSRNEGTLEQNLRAGIKFLARKGFGVSGRAIAHRPDAYFDSWREALMRYNGRTDTLRDGRAYRSAYADRVLRRARNPELFVPIAIDHHRK